MCCHKRQQVAEKYCIHIGKFILSKEQPIECTRILNILSSPTSQLPHPVLPQTSRCPCESTRVTSWYCYRYASWNVQNFKLTLIEYFCSFFACLHEEHSRFGGVWTRLNSSQKFQPLKLACTGLLVQFLPPPVLVTKPQLSLQRFWFEFELGENCGALMAAL